MVTSPFAQKQQLVNVTGMAPGDTVKDPYLGSIDGSQTNYTGIAKAIKTKALPYTEDNKSQIVLLLVATNSKMHPSK